MSRRPRPVWHLPSSWPPSHERSVREAFSTSPLAASPLQGEAERLNGVTRDPSPLQGRGGTPEWSHEGPPRPAHGERVGVRGICQPTMKPAWLLACLLLVGAACNQGAPLAGVTAKPAGAPVAAQATTAPRTPVPTLDPSTEANASWKTLVG